MTVEICDALCPVSTFYGLEYGDECWCGDLLQNNAFESLDDICTMECAGDSTELCGGMNALSLYQRAGDAPIPASAINYSLVGCFSEPEGGRALVQRYGGAGKMSIELCMYDCGAGGYTYAGLEYADECWCGNDIPTLTPSDSCDMACLGKPAETCGGMNTLQLYMGTA
jgi:hypothetical protein